MPEDDDCLCTEDHDDCEEENCYCEAHTEKACIICNYRRCDCDRQYDNWKDLRLE